MSYKKLLVPIGTALAALVGNGSEASVAPSDTQRDSSDLQEKVASSDAKSRGLLLQRITYQIQEQAHTLILHKSSAGVLYAGHGSHASHGSHQSHGSHRSGY